MEETTIFASTASVVRRVISDSIIHSHVETLNYIKLPPEIRTKPHPISQENKQLVKVFFY